ncbi:hypothetical protein HWV62_1444 [Athelia sp. TMB]|nr:hypothetical protein HWV62_1444 [Athelia sp. TMB]
MLLTVDATSAPPPSAGAQSTAAVATTPGKKQSFTFDQVHPPSITQHALFTSTAEPLVARFVDGYNCTILAYGQTSSGKTFTMTGIDLDADPSDSTNGMGIIPRAVSHIFSRARHIKEERGAAWSYTIKGSFVELYNEDLLDLLSTDDVSGGRREVQIREDKDGHIIWGGLREVQVKNAGEVMNLIRQGTSIRRTNETDMNAQSSRSHAIFSLTLVQKKYTGSGGPPSTRSSSPLPPGGRSPSRLARPGSMMMQPTAGRASPSFGRPSTPSFQSGIASRGGLRPASSLGLRPPDRRDSIAATDNEDTGEWTTIVSKFHFVDLAGSERLKRTAAAGDRIKEGISINSGLLALGNVISALGDPSRSKSHTATHIPYRDSKLTRLLQDSLGGNAHTLMIACVSPAEWNAGETINTLKYANRARNIKNRAVVNEKEDGWDDVEWLQGTVMRLRKDLKSIKEGGAVNGTIHEAPEEVQGAGRKVLAQMTDLQNNYEDLREKFVERTEELTRLRRELGTQQRGSTGGALAGTAKYEEIVGPVIEEYEKTISAMEAELSLNRAALRHTNEMVEEKEDELAIITERHAATELYVEDLRARVSKLGEREASTEAYVRDLEEKIKSYDETTMSSSESMSDLKRELAKFKETESHSSRYIIDLETRLARADESVLALQQTVERLESDSERRRDEIQVLQTRLENLSSDGTSWRSDLEQREQKLKVLEAQMAEWERKRQEAGEQRLRLGAVVGSVALARKSLENLVPASPADTSGFVTPVSEMPSPLDNSISVEAQLVSLQQTHTATLADLSSVTAKYRDSLREISDLAAQIQEAKLSNSAVLPEVPEPPTPTEIQHMGARRLTNGLRRQGSDRRLFYRAASTDSLHSRSLSQSQSLSQELTSARSRNASTSSHGTSNSISNGSPSRSRPNLSISLSNSNFAVINPQERSVTSLEQEILRLQEVLHQREAEITILETSLRERAGQAPSPLPVTEEENHEGARGLESYLSPQTTGKFEEIRKNLTMQNGYPEPSESSMSDEADASLQRLNELMLSMAQKESQHREEVDELNAQLSQVRRQHDDLTALAQGQALNMSTELEALRGKHDEQATALEHVQQREAELTESLRQAEADHAQAVQSIRAEHEEALRVKEAEVEALITRTKEEHAAVVSGLTEQLSQASASLEKAHQEHTAAFGKLQGDHEAEIQRRVQEANDVLDRTVKEHQASLAALQSDHDRKLKQQSEEASATLQHTEEEYYELLAKLRIDHSEAMEKHKTDAAATLERLREEHAGELRMAEIAREGSLSESQESQAAALKGLQDEHAAAIARKEASFNEDLLALKSEHARALSIKDDDHRSKRDSLKAEHASSIARIREESEMETERLNLALKKAMEEASAAAAQMKDSHEAATRALQENQAAILEAVAHGHEDEVERLKSIHDTAIKDAIALAEQQRSALAQSHTEEMAKLKAEHQSAMAEAGANLIAAQEQHRQVLAEAREQSERLIAQHQVTMSASLAEMEKQHTAERETLSKDRILLSQQVASQKTSIEELQTQNKVTIAEEWAKTASTITDLSREHTNQYETLRKSHDQLAEELRDHQKAAEDTAAGHQVIIGSHEKALSEKTEIISQLKQQLSGAHSEKGTLEQEIAKLRVELESTRSEQAKLAQDASKRESMTMELERHRSSLAELQENLEKVKDEKDSIQAQRNKQDTLIRDLQQQLARTTAGTPDRQVERNLSYNRANGLPPMKLPPPTPPPSAPPPPAPRNDSISSQSSVVRSSTTSSRESQQDSPTTPSTSVAGHSTINGPVSPLAEPKLVMQLEKQAKHIEEQDAMIKTLNKQLSHCETDLQAHMDLVSTLETSLGDSEKNLRKARMHATELARERDALTNQIDSLRNQLHGAKQEVDTVRRSIAEEKQTLEQRLDEERKAKERARHQLDTRMEELQKRKSKFACL